MLLHHFTVLSESSDIFTLMTEMIFPVLWVCLPVFIQSTAEKRSAWTRSGLFSAISISSNALYRTGSCHKKYFLPQEIFPATGNISCSKIYLLVIDELYRSGISRWIAWMNFADLQEMESSHISCYTTTSSSFIFLVIIPCYLHSSL